MPNCLSRPFEFLSLLWKNTKHHASNWKEKDKDEALRDPLLKPELPNTPGEKHFPMDASNVGKPSQPMRTSPRVGLVNLPTEIIEIIRDQIPPESAAALAMTCHQMFHITGTGWITMDLPARFRFLEYYEPKVPLRFLCQFCVKLHRYTDTRAGDMLYLEHCPRLRRLQSHARAKETVQDLAIQSLIPPNLRDSSRALFPSYSREVGQYSDRFTMNERRFSFSTVQLTMNRHFLGPKHGLPLSALHSVSRSPGDGFFAVSYVVTTEARVVNGELILQTKHHFSGDQMPLTDFFVRFNCLMLCPHVKIVGPCTNRVIDTSCQYVLISPIQIMRCNVLQKGSCTSCATDYRVKSQRDSDSGPRLLVESWQNLGSGKSVNDPKWQSCCDTQRYLPGWERTSVTHEKFSTKKAFKSVSSTAPLPKVCPSQERYYEVTDHLGAEMRRLERHGCATRHELLRQHVEIYSKLTKVAFPPYVIQTPEQTTKRFYVGREGKQRKSERTSVDMPLRRLCLSMSVA